MQKKCPPFEFPGFLLPTNLIPPMHSQSALTEVPSLNLVPFILLNPVWCDPEYENYVQYNYL